MKLCLINTPYLDVYGKINVGHNSCYPLGLGYIASVAKKHGHKVVLLDPEAEGIDRDQCLARIKQFGPDLIGLSCVTSNFNNACLLSEWIKENIQCPVMVGGVHVTALPEKSLRDCSSIDFVVQGEGEYVVAAICDAMEEKRFDISQIPSVCYRQDGKIVRNRRMPFIEKLDEIPYPDRESVRVDWYRLQPHFERGKLHATIMSSRGCPSSCTFCGNIVTGRKFRPHSVKCFVDEIELLIRDHKVRHFHVVDDNFAADKDRVFKICEEILRRKLKITWFIFGRIDQLGDENMLRLMKKAGCVYILFGVESGSQKILDVIRKNITIDQIVETCRICRKVGIRYFNSFIIGSPEETAETIKETVDLAIDLRSVMAGFNIMIPFPGTPIFNKYYKESAELISDWSNWCSVGDKIPFEYNHTELSGEQLLKMVARAYSRYYIRPGQLLRMLRFGYNPKIILSYIRGGFGLARAFLNWLGNNGLKKEERLS